MFEDTSLIQSSLNSTGKAFVKKRKKKRKKDSTPFITQPSSCIFWMRYAVHLSAEIVNTPSLIKT